MKLEKGTDNKRIHVGPRDWASQSATDYWLQAGHVDHFTVTAEANPSGLSGWGWVTTSLSLTSGTGADLLSSSDIGNSTRVIFGAPDDLLQGPRIFGDDSARQMVEAIFGYSPTKLIMECHATFTDATNNETATGFGFVQDGGSPLVAADHLAMITSDGTNFVCRSSADSDVGAVDDTTAHLWRIEMTAGASATDAVEWFIDGTSQGTFDLIGDQFPCTFGGGILTATGANFFGISWVHIWYE